MNLYGQSEIPASKSTFTSGVSTRVHMDLTPRLSAAKGITFILSSTSINPSSFPKQRQKEKNIAVVLYDFGAEKHEMLIALFVA